MWIGGLDLPPGNLDEHWGHLLVCRQQPLLGSHVTKQVKELDRNWKRAMPWVCDGSCDLGKATEPLMSLNFPVCKVELIATPPSFPGLQGTGRKDRVTPCQAQQWLDAWQPNHQQPEGCLKRMSVKASLHSLESEEKEKEVLAKAWVKGSWRHYWRQKNYSVLYQYGNLYVFQKKKSLHALSPLVFE